MTAASATTKATMKAIVQDTYGTSEVLEVRDIDRPDVGEDQVLVRVEAAGVNPADWAVMNGLPYVARPVYGLRRPKNPVRGTDVAGVIEAVGSNVTSFQPGDEVFGSADGSYAEYAVAAEERLAPKPAHLSFEQAGALPMAGLVALQAIRDHGDVRAGQQVLINGASGGIGHLAVQIAHSLGAHVTGVCSTRNLELVRSLGADQVIDYTQHDFAQGGQRYDFVLDNVADRSMSELRHVLTPNGTLIPNGGGFDNRWFANGGRVIHAHILKRTSSHRVRPFLVSNRTTYLAALSELVEAGSLTPVIDRAHPLTEAPQAIAYVGEGHTAGKVIITI
jgi:NADPH:quinone reductase-like Zn-dependent oxidoreductase